MVKDFLFNVTILISMFTIFGQLFKNHPLRKNSTMQVKGLWGIALGILGLILMIFSIHITNQTIADLRHVATVIAAAFGGMPVAIISAAIIALGRILFFDWNSASILAAVNMLVIGVCCGFIAKSQLSRHQQAFFMNLVSFALVSITLYLNLQNMELLTGILKYHFVFSMLGCAFAYHGASYIARSNQSMRDLKLVTEKYQTVVDHVKEVIFQTDAAGRWTFLNPAWEEFLGFSVTSSIGQSWMELIHPEDQAYNRQAYQALIQEKVDFCRHESRFLTKNGDYKWAEIFARLTKDQNGQIIGASGTLMDIDDRKKAEEALVDSKMRYKTLATLSPDGIIVHSEGKIIFINDFGSQLLGADNRKEILYKPIETIVDPSALPMVLEQTNRLFLHKTSVHLVERKYRRVDGRTIDVEASASFVQYDGKPSIMVIFRDISKRKEMENDLIESEERFRLIAENSSDLITMHDEYGNLVYVSPACQEILQYSQEEMLDKSGYDFAHPEDIPVIVAQHSQLFELGHSVTTYRVRKKNGQYIWFETSERLMKHGKDKGAKIIAVSRNVTERKLAEQKMAEANELLSKLSIVDGLTQIANRRFFDQRMEQEWELAKVSSCPLALIMVDIDHFKAYNDSYGHQAGDDCLKLVAQTFQMNLDRTTDVVCRYGGEEFGIILPDTDLEQAELIAEKIQSSIENLRIPHKGSKVGEYLTVSIGIASTFPTADTEAAELVRSADIALYQAKHEGRNKVIVKKPNGQR